jgi:hypothetical protein
VPVLVERRWEHSLDIVRRAAIEKSMPAPLHDGVGKTVCDALLPSRDQIGTLRRPAKVRNGCNFVSDCRRRAAIARHREINFVQVDPQAGRRCPAALTS